MSLAHVLPSKYSEGLKSNSQGVKGTALGLKGGTESCETVLWRDLRWRKELSQLLVNVKFIYVAHKKTTEVDQIALQLRQI